MKELVGAVEAEFVQLMREAVEYPIDKLHRFTTDDLLEQEVRSLRYRWSFVRAVYQDAGLEPQIRSMLSGLDLTPIKRVRMHYLTHWLGELPDNWVIDAVKELAGGKYAGYLTVPIYDECRWLRHVRGRYVLEGRTERFVSRLLKSGLGVEVVAAFAHFMAFKRMVHEVHVDVDTVSLRPEIDYYHRRLRWSWQCPLCSQRHAVIMLDMTAKPPRTVGKLCEVPCSVPYWYTRVSGKTLAVASDLLLEVAILNNV